MKRILPVFVLTLLMANIAVGQHQYEVLVERPGEKSLKGIISRELLENDTSFRWYAENLKGYTPNARALKGLRENKDSIRLLVFMGTWCEDSHLVIPKMFSLLDAAGFPKDRVSLVGVDRAKTTLGHLEAALDVKNVPTIMVMKNGRELGRVVEFGKYGLFDMELGEILAGIGN
jgi:hypothetical protein